MSLFTKEASSIWGAVLHDAHTFLQGVEHNGKVTATTPLPITLPVDLPASANSLVLLQAAFGVLGKAIIAARDAEAARAEGFVNIELDQQEITDLISLIDSMKPVFAILSQMTHIDADAPKAPTAVAPVASVSVPKPA